MKRSKLIILFSFFILLLVFVTVVIDLGSFFGYTDIAFLIAFMLYFLFLFIQKASGKMSYGIAFYYLVLAGMSFIFKGNAFMTDRLVVWFYLFFLLASIQSLFELNKDK